MVIYMAYKGKWKPKNVKKYKGDYTKIVYRSLWERNVFRWMDANPDVVKWNSEEVIVPYISGTDRKFHRYFVDIYFKHKNKKVYLVEIKPKKETIPPKKKGRQTKKYVAEAMTYVKNQSKWEAATEYAKSRGWHFQVWHEDTLRNLGIKILR